MNDFYNSTEFKAKANESAAFLSDLAPYLDGRPVNLQNMVSTLVFLDNVVAELITYIFLVECERCSDMQILYRLTWLIQIFDFMNVNSIHNATFLNSLPPTYLAQTRALANWHQYNSFSDPSINGIGNGTYHSCSLCLLMAH